MSTKEEILDKIQTIIWTINKDTKDHYRVRENLDKEVPLDSLDRLALLTDLESAYSIDINMEEAESLNLRYPNNLLDYLEKRLQG